MTDAITDGYGRTVYSQTQAPSGWDTVEAVFDATGRQIKTSNPYNTGHAPAAGSQFTVTAFDGVDRRTSVTAVDGSATSYSYTQNATKVIDPKGVARITTTDGLGNIWKVCEVSTQTGNSACGLPISGSGFLTSYTYDMDRRLTQVSQGVQTRSRVYDQMGRATSATEPESGTTTYTYDSSTDSTCLNSSSSSAGDLILTTDAASMKTCLNYDTWRRVTRKGQYIAAGNTPIYTYTFDGSAANHSLGRLASATAPATSESFVYDTMGRPTSVTEAPALGSYTTSYTYNYAGKATSIGTPSSRTLNYSYDTKARLTQIQHAGTSVNYISARSFNAADQVTGQNMGGSALTFSATYNNVLRPFQWTYVPGAGSTLTLQHQWGNTIDGQGNVTSSDNNGTLRKLIDVSNSNRTMTYTYDDMKRILSGTEADNAIVANMTTDKYGNRVSQSGTLNQSFTVDANTNRINSSGFGYDSAGRMTAGNWGGFARTLTWDPDGKLQTYTDGSTPTITYSLDPFGRRIKATPTSGSPTYYFYGSAEGGHPVSEYTTAWQTDVVGEGRVIATADSAAPPNVTYVANDYLGTTKMTVSGSGSPSSVATYYPYGEEGISISSEYKLTNQIRENSGVDHFWHRKYAGGPARWLTPDPATAGNQCCGDPRKPCVRHTLLSPQEWNRF